MPDLSDQRLDNYLLQTRLSAGPLTSVYIAADETGSPALLKLVQSTLAEEPSFQPRFLELIQSVFNFNHEGLVKIHNYGQQPSQLYWVVDQPPGENLANLLKNPDAPAPSSAEVLSIIAQVAKALDYAHKRGVLHTECRPEHIQLYAAENEDGPSLQVKLGGFVTANLLSEPAEDTENQYSYVAPEQCLESALDGRVDIYALGVIYYQLLSGDVPFVLPNQTKAVHTHLTSQPTPLGQLRPDLPPAFSAIAAQALAKQPSQRFKSAGAFAIACEQLLVELPRMLALPTPGKIPLTDYLRTGTPPIAADLPSTPEQEPDSSTEGPSVGGGLLSPQYGTYFTDRQESTDLVTPQNGERILFTYPGQSTQTLHLFKPLIGIGRLRDNDLVLNAPEISRRHARLARKPDGWYVTDLDSLAKTYLNGKAIPVEVPVFWPEDSPLQIGPYTCYWLSSAAAARERKMDRRRVLAPPPVHSRSIHPSASTMRRSSLSFSRPSPSPPKPLPLPRGAIQIHSNSGNLTVVVTPVRNEIEPGAQVETQVSVHNISAEELGCRLTVTGLPTAWFSSQRDHAQLAAGEKAQLNVHLHPPQKATSSSGTHHFQLHIQISSEHDETLIIPTELVIKPFHQYQAALMPVPGNVAGYFQVQIKNEGNAANRFSVTGRAISQPVQFLGERGRIGVAPNELQTVDLMLKPENRPLLGRGHTAVFQVTVKNEQGEPQTVNGELPIRPIISTGALTLLVLLTLLFTALLWVARGNGPVFSQAEITPAGPEINTTALAQDVGGADETRRAAMLFATGTAAFSTQTAATATALHEQTLGDGDGDGLSDGREQELGTLVDNPDTDNDGLSDGREVNELGTNPRQLDTDGDGLSDGDEVNKYLTSPLSSDTDGDGLADILEIQNGSDPLLPPGTSTPTATTSATATKQPIDTSPPAATPRAGNTPPLATNDLITTSEDTTTTFTVLGNDSDANGDPLVILNISGSQRGASIVLQVDGTLRYTPPADYHGGDSFTYTISDGDVTATATVLVTITAVNDAPVANDDIVSAIEDTIVTFNPLNNDTDVDANNLTIITVSQPAHGIVTNNGGSLSYKPEAQYIGVDTFNYTISDGQASSNNATVTINITSVNDPPTFTPGNDETIFEDAGGISRLGWATNINPGNAEESEQQLTFVVTTDNPPLFAVPPAIDATSGTLTYTPAENMNGMANVAIYLQDNGGTANGGLDQSSTHQLQIEVISINDSPNFNGGGDVVVLEDAGAVNHSAWATGISAGAPNESTQTLTFEVTANDDTLFAVQPGIDPLSGDLTYTPAPNANGSTTLSIRLSDNGGTANGGSSQSAESNMTVAVTAVNDAPSLLPGDSITVTAGSGVALSSGWATAISTGPANESSQELLNNPLTLSGSNDALFSVLPSLNLNNGDISFTPAADSGGVTTFQFAIQDNGGTAHNGSDTSDIYILQIIILLPVGRGGFETLAN